MADPPPEILIVDDDPFNASLIAELCEGLGYRTRIAHDGAGALASVAAERPDLVLLDLAMPQMDGFEVLEKLKAAESSATIPVVIVTAISDLDAKVRGIELGADDYLTKPFKLFELKARIRAALQLRHYQNRLEQAQAALLSQTGIDPLTGAGIFAQLHAFLDYEVSRARRYGRPLSLLFLAIDDFDAWRERLGAAEEDRFVLKLVETIRASTRGIDRIFRLDDEEFVVLLPETSAEGATAVARRIQEAVRAIGSAEATPTVSIGLAAFPHPEIRGGEQLLKAASDARHLARRSGRGAIARHG
ncbi:MAG: response regulator [Deltaproteobacteria bacterium]|nr:MAG: response regulator [Deltaproteobacteria bacterium]